MPDRGVGPAGCPPVSWAASAGPLVLDCCEGRWSYGQFNDISRFPYGVSATGLRELAARRPGASGVVFQDSEGRPSGLGRRVLVMTREGPQRARTLIWRRRVDTGRTSGRASPRGPALFW